MKRLLLLLLIIPLCAKAQNLEKLSAFYSEGQFEKAIAFGEEVLKTDPNNIETNLMVGRAYTDLGNYRQAISYLQKATADTIVQKWKPAWANAYLGTCYFGLGDFELSKKHYEASIALKATKNCDRYAQRRYTSLPLNAAYKTWETIESEHFRFHFQNKNEIKNADDFMNRREEAFAKINQFIHCTLTQKIEFYVWNDPEEAAKTLSQPLGFSLPELFVIQSANNQTTGHEITHIICYQALKTTSTRQFINEGVAVYFDQTKRNKMATAQTALKGRPLDVYELWAGRQGNADILYPAGGAFIEYLMSQGTSEQLKKLLANQSVENAKNIYPNLDQLVRILKRTSPLPVPF